MKLSINLAFCFALAISLPAAAIVPDSLKSRIDSLRMFLNDPDVKTRYAVEFGIAWHLFDVDNPVAVQYARRAHGSALLIGDTTTMIKSGRILGQLLIRVDQPDSAASTLKQVLLLAEYTGDQKEAVKIASALTALYNEWVDLIRV